MIPFRRFSESVALFCLVLASGPLQGQVTTPEEEFGFPIGADYELVNYAQLQAYWARLAGESDRMVLDTIGYTEEGRPQLMAIITSSANQRDLAHYKEIARRLALANGVTEEEGIDTLGALGPGIVLHVLL